MTDLVEKAQRGRLTDDEAIELGSALVDQPSTHGRVS
jgi:hypothetical protein